MQTKTNRRGLAIGAAIAMIGTFFGAAPASFATTNGAHIDIRPASNASTTNFGGLLTEDFPIYAQLKSGTSNASFSDSLRWEVTYVSGTAPLAVVPTNEGTIGSIGTTGIRDGYGASSTSDQIASLSALGTVAVGVKGVTVSHTTSVVGGVATVDRAASVSAGVAKLYLRPVSTSALTSTSTNAVYDVRVYIDDFGGSNGQYDVGEWFTTQRITFFATGNLSTGASVGSPAALDTVVTASAQVSGVNWSNLNGKLFFQVSSSDTTAIFTGNDNTSASPALSGATASLRDGSVTFSFGVTSLTESTTVSGHLRYATETTPTVSNGVQIGAIVNKVVSRPGVTSLSISAVAGANVVGGGTAYNVRLNQTYTIRVLASTGSASVSTDVTVTLGGATLATSSKEISINGAAFTSRYSPTGFTVTTGTNGVGSFTVATSGFLNGETLTVNAKIGNFSATQVTLTAQSASFAVTDEVSGFAVTTPGAAVSLPFVVKDQWGELATRSDLFLKVTRGGTGFNYATTVSYQAVTAGKATVAFTPAPATATGSATVLAEVVRLENGAYLSDIAAGSDTVTVTVTSSALAFGSGLAVSRAASVSYFADTVSWVTVTGNASAAGAPINVTGTDLVFRLNSSVPATTSGTFTMNAGSGGAYSFQVAGLKAGTKVMTLTTGTATTTSQVVVAAAASDMGRTITWDTTTIEAGKTRVITGTLADMNGNGVDTTGVGRTAGDSGTASIVVTYTGTAGIVVGTMPTETDADGKFRISVLTSAADSGTMTLTAVYMPQGSSTVDADKRTSVQTVNVVPATAPEVNAVIGSFNGRWAVRVENAKGSVVSVKAGNRWVKFTSLNNNYLFSRKSVVGRTIAVSVWVDGELQNSQTITIK